MGAFIRATLHQKKTLGPVCLCFWLTQPRLPSKRWDFSSHWWSLVVHMSSLNLIKLFFSYFSSVQKSIWVVFSSLYSQVVHFQSPTNLVTKRQNCILIINGGSAVLPVLLFYVLRIGLFWRQIWPTSREYTFLSWGVPTFHNSLSNARFCNKCFLRYNK